MSIEELHEALILYFGSKNVKRENKIIKVRPVWIDIDDVGTSYVPSISSMIDAIQVFLQSPNNLKYMYDIINIPTVCEYPYFKITHCDKQVGIITLHHSFIF